MARLSEGDNRFKHPIQVESENENSRQLLQIQLDEQQSQNAPDLEGNDHRDAPTGLRNGPQLALHVKQGKLFPGEGQTSSDFDCQEKSTDVSSRDSGCFQKATKERNVKFIGLLSGTTRKSYPCTSGVVGTRYRMSYGKTEKPKFICDGKTVVVYEPLQQNSQLQPAVLSFTTENGRENEIDMD